MAHYTLHGMLTLYSNALSDIRIARDAGFDGLEVHTEKLWRYLNAGGTAELYKEQLDAAGISLTAIDIIGGVEMPQAEAQQKCLKETQVLCVFAQKTACPVIQLNGFCGLSGLSLEQNLEITAQNIRKICAVGKKFGIRFQYEGAAWTPIHRLQDCLRLIHMVDQENFGLVIDFWHLWAGRGTKPQELAKLDSRHIFGVHLCDGLRPALGEPWQPEEVYRKFLPGEGELPVGQWLAAVKEAGYRGSYSGEILNPWLWEQDHLQLAGRMRQALASFVEA